MNILWVIQLFPVYGTEVRVFDENLCEAIKALSERQRKIYGGLAKWNVYKNVHDFQLSVQQ